MKKYLLFILLTIISLQCVNAQQTTRNNTTNNNGWLMYFGNHKLSEKIGIHAEIQWRRHNGFSDHQQLLLRTGIDYYTANNNRFTVGYAFVKTYPYGDFAVNEAFPEHRIWQQFLTTQSIGRLKLSHRYRLEQRMIGNATTGEFKNGRYENRFRYMAKAVYTFNTEAQHPIFCAVYDEIFINFGKEVAYNIFDQNRLYGAVGFTVSPAIKIEAGYLYQLIQLRSLDLTVTPLNKIENNHTLQLGLYSTIPFFNKG